MGEADLGGSKVFLCLELTLCPVLAGLHLNQVTAQMSPPLLPTHLSGLHASHSLSPMFFLSSPFLH